MRTGSLELEHVFPVIKTVIPCENVGTETHSRMGNYFSHIYLGTIHKQHLLRGGGRGDPPKGDERQHR